MSDLPVNPISAAKRTWLYIFLFFKWLIHASMVGFFVGSAATVFNHLLKFVTDYRNSHPVILWFLPFAGLIIAFLYNSAKSGDSLSTDLVISAVRDEARVPVKMAPLIFIATALTHLFGGSAGREGVALQLGGSLGQFLGDRFDSNENEKKVLIMCGMSAAFSSLFGTPMAAAIFSLEIASIGAMYYFALVPCVISSVIAVSLTSLSGIGPEKFHLAEFSIGMDNIGGIVLLAALCGGLSIIFCTSIHHFGHTLKKFLPNPYARVFAGGCAVVALTYLVGSRDYLGAGMNIIEHAVEGHVFIGAFVLKLIFTGLTLGSGYKGGEIVPTLFVGATFGCAVAPLVGISPSLGAAIGMMALFCGVTNCPIASLLLSFELFSFSSPIIFMIAISISFMLSGCYGLYSSQKIIYSKNMPDIINRTAH